MASSIPSSHPLLRDWLKKADDLGLLPGLVGLTVVTFVARSVGLWPPLPLLAGSFLIGVLTYAVDRAADLLPGQLSDAAKLPRGFLPVVFCLLAAVILFEAFAGNWLVAGFYLLAPTAGFLYSWPWASSLFGVQTRYRCIKDIPLIKSFYIALCWSFYVVLTALYLGRFPLAAFVPTLLIVYERTFQGVVACDFKDIQNDRMTGVVTFPVRFGFAATTRLLQVVAASSFVFLIVCVLDGWVNPRMWILVVHYAALASCVQQMKKPGTDLFFHCALIDLLYLMWLPMAFML